MFYMKIIKLCLLLVTCSNFIFANTVSTGHAEVSIVKSSINQTAANELIIGIKMDMQNHWHTYWKNPGDSGGPVRDYMGCSRRFRNRPYFMAYT